MKSLELLIGLKRGVKIAFLLFLIPLMVLLPENMYAQHTENKLKISFGEFNRIDHENYHKSLQIDITSLLKPGLLNIDYLKFVDVISGKLNDSKTQQNSTSINNEDLSLSGSYAIYQNTFMIDVDMIDTSNNRPININPITGELDELYLKLDGLKKNIIDAIESKWLSQIAGKKKIAIICKVKNKKRFKDLDLAYFKQITIKTTKKIKQNPYTSITSWDKAAQYYLSEIDNQEIAKNLQVDALLIANVSLNKGDPTVSPSFYIKDSSKLIDLGEIKSSYFTNIALYDGLAFRANSFFDNIIKKDGRWNIDMYLEEADGFDGYFRLGYDYCLLSLPSISNYYYFKALKFDNNSSDLHYNMALNYKTMGRTEIAKQEFRKSINIDSSKSDSYYHLWKLHIKETHYKKALDLAKEAKKNVLEDPNHNTDLMMGVSLYLNYEYQNAIKHLENGVKASPKNAALYAYLGLNYKAIFQYKKALENFKSAYEFDPKNPDYQYYLANILISIGNKLLLEKKYKEALTYLLASRKYDTIDYVSNYIQKCYLRIGELQKAEQTFDEYLNKGYLSEKKDYYKFAIQIRMALLDQENTLTYLSKSYEEALLKYIGNHLEHNPKDAFAFWTLGNTFHHLKDNQKSLEYLEKAYAINKTNSSIFLDLAESYLLNKQYKKSDEIYYNIFKNNSSLTGKDKILLTLIHISNVAATKNKFEHKKAKDIYQLIAQGKKVTGWSFTVFKTWMEQTLDKETKIHLTELVNAIENSETTIDSASKTLN